MGAPLGRTSDTVSQVTVGGSVQAYSGSGRRVGGPLGRPIRFQPAAQRGVSSPSPHCLAPAGSSLG